MDSSRSANVLVPSFFRAFFRVLAQLIGVMAFAAVIDHYQSGKWWGLDYLGSLLIPLTIFPVIVFVMFTPRRIEWSETEFRIQPRFGVKKSILWAQLYAYGNGNNVFMLQFEGLSTFQIFGGAFEPGQWKAFRIFLKNKYPDRKAGFWFGPKAIRKNRRS